MSKRTCNNCKALVRSSNGINYRCELGYKIDNVFSDKLGIVIKNIPLEECPKPKTYSDYIECRRG